MGIAATTPSLLAHAAAPDDPDTRLFARLVSHAASSEPPIEIGLDIHDVAALLTHFFPRMPAPMQRQLTERIAGRSSNDPFTARTHALLQAHRSDNGDTSRWLSGILVQACLRPDHLWRDLGLNGRDDVTALLARHFPTLAAGNVHQWRWKKYLAYAAADLAGAPRSPAPGCPGCEERSHCYPNLH